MCFTNTRLRALALLGLLSLVLSACSEPTRSPMEAPLPSFGVTPDCVLVNGSPDGHIYNPCVLDGIVVVGRRQPLDPPTWFGSGRGCTSLEGGCFPPGERPIIGYRPYYNQGGGSAQARGEEQGWSSPVLAFGAKKADIQLAIAHMLQWDVDDQCAPLIAAMSSRVRWGIYIGGSGYRYGEWVGEEPNGTIYINSAPGYNWDANGNVRKQGQADEPLRNTLIEEMIHMWFDTDVSDGGGDKGTAMAAMRTACGYRSF